MTKPLVVLLCACGLSADLVKILSSAMDTEHEVIIVGSSHTLEPRIDDLLQPEYVAELIRDKRLRELLFLSPPRIAVSRFSLPAETFLGGLGNLDNMRNALTVNNPFVGIGGDRWGLVATLDRAKQNVLIPADHVTSA